MKNIKVEEDIHQKLIEMSNITGMRIAKLTELAISQLYEDFETGKFGIFTRNEGQASHDGIDH